MSGFFLRRDARPLPIGGLDLEVSRHVANGLGIALDT